MNRKVAYFASASVLLLSTGALAASDTQNMTVQATITAGCTLTINAALNFGNVATTASATTAQTTATVNCASAIPFNVGMDNGQDGSARVMWDSTNGAVGHQLAYDVFTDNTYTDPYGPAILGQPSGNFSSSGAAGDTVITFYGQIPIQATPVAGAYSDTLAVTVVY